MRTQFINLSGRFLWPGLGVIVLCLSLLGLSGATANAVPLLEPLPGVILDDFSREENNSFGMTDEGSSWVTNEDILGGEREVTAAATSLRFTWDGHEADPSKLDATGLGGVDLTQGGRLDQLHLTIRANSSPARLTLELYSDDSRVSSYELQVDVLTAAATYTILLADLTGNADLGHIGAISLLINGQNALPNLELGSLVLASSLNTARGRALVVDNNSNGLADPGDVWEHTIVINNNSGRVADPITWSDVFPGRATALVNGSVTISQGQILSGNTPGDILVHINTGVIADGTVVTLTYRENVNSQGIVTVELVVQDGDIPTGTTSPVTSLNYPTTNGAGQVGFTGGVTGDNFVWFDDAPILFNSSIPTATVTGAETTMGIGDANSFLYSPAYGGGDAAYSHNGPVLVEGDPAPGFPANTNNIFNSRPSMIPGGQAYWVAGFNDAGGTTTLGRVLHVSPTATAGNINVVIRSDDIVAGLPIDRPAGVGFDYQIADNGTNHVHELLLDTGSTTNDDIIYVNGNMVARELSPTGDGDNWDNFGVVSINNSGNYVFTGDTDGAAATDGFLAYNGAVAIREGATIGGITLVGTTSAPRALGINNLNQVAHIWGVTTTAEYLFISCDATNMSDADLLLAIGDQVDVDGNGSADATVTDFAASTAIGNGIVLAENGLVYVEVNLDYGSGNLEAIIGVNYSGNCGAPTANVSPASLSDTHEVGVITVTTQTVTISNTGTVDLTWTLDFDSGADCATPDGNLPWASATPLNGTTTPASGTPVDVVFNSSALAGGVYTGTLCVTSNDMLNSPIAVDLTLDVLQAVANVTPNNIAATHIAGATVGYTTTHPITISNTGTADLNWAIAFDSGTNCAAPDGNAPWAGASPLNGTSLPAGSNPITVELNSLGLVAGVYTGTLCVVSNDPANPAIAVALSLTVSLPTDVSLTSFGTNPVTGWLMLVAGVSLMMLGAFWWLTRPRATPKA